jgi:subtilisin family serine protease
MRRKQVWLALGIVLLCLAAFGPWGALAQPANPFSSGSPAPAPSSGATQSKADPALGNPALAGVPLRNNWWLNIPNVNQATKMNNELATQLASARNAPVGFMVYLKAQADTSNHITDWNAKGEYVLNQLQRVANATQPALMKAVAGLQASNNLTGKVSQFTILNAVFVHGNSAAATALASRDDVAFLDADHAYFPMDNGSQAAVEASIDAQGAANASAPDTVELGVQTVHAPQAWAEGYFGQGIVVGSIDTGVQYNHPALVRQYRGNLGGGQFDHNYNWWDARLDAPRQNVPYDDFGHGTHTMGTVMGEDASMTNQIGVAPHAKWIAAKVFPNGGSSGNEEITPAEDFMIAPWDLTGNNRRPDLRPNIVTNSWGDNECWNTDSWLITQVWIDDGMMPFFANGNAGPGAHTVGSPGGYPFLVGVGAIQASNLTIAGFSSRGPSCYGGVIKPDVVAPGVSVRSSIPTNSYGIESGTSMATPHTSGVAALILSANPTLDYTDVMGIMTRTAYFQQSWGARPNNNYGWGLVQADSAINMALHGPHLSGMVNGGGSPLQGAQVTAVRTSDNDTYGKLTHSGAYSMTLLAGTYDISASAFGYVPQTLSAQVLMTDTNYTRDFNLTALPAFPVSGHLLLNGACTPVSGTVTINPSGWVIHDDPGTGSYNVNLPAGTYTFTASGGVAHQPISQQVVVSGPTTQNFTFGPAYDSSYVADTPAFTWISGTNQLTITQGGEDGYTSAVMPFSFNYYGNSYSTLYIGVNGYATFNPISQYSMWANTNIPNPGPTPAAGDPPYPNNAIYPYWDDLAVAPRAYGNIYSATTGSAPNRIFTVEWRGVAGAGAPITFELQLAETTNTITFEYASLDAPYGYGYSSTEGIENNAGTVGIQLSFNQMGEVGNNMAIRFSPGTPPVINPCPVASPTPTTPPASTPTTPPTSTPTIAPVATDTPTVAATPTVCTISFSDVPVGSTFYPFVHCLACLGIINGYPDGTFHPNGQVTRGQLSKIVSNSAGFNDNQTTQMFEDVPVGSTFFQFIGRLASRGFISGYACGGPGEPCGPTHLPYFRPGNNATRGQISKIDSNAAGFSDPPHGQQFQDILPGSTFYTYTYRLVTRQAMAGYQCGQQPNEPCVPPNHLPYFRPNNNATRGQTSKIVSNTFFPDCNPAPPLARP